jgi:glycosyltransferase involved in cell wall biosynthesis
MNKLVSIITPCYNGESYIQRFLDSVLAQTYNNFEFIIINDGSTDDTEKILNSYIERFALKGIEYIVINQENKGQSEAINQGLKIFKGDYLSWVDSDDILSPKYIEAKVSFLEKNTDCGLVISKSSIVNENNLNKELGILKRIKPKGRDTLCEDLIIGKNIYYAPGGYMVRSSCFFDVNPNRSIISPRECGQNYQLLIPISYKYKCGYLDEVLYTYVVRNDSHSHTTLSWENTLKKYDIARNDVLENVIKSMNIPDENYYMRLIEWRYIHWLMDAAAEYKNLPLLKEQIEKLKEINMYTTKDLIFFWKGRFWIVNFFWRVMNFIKSKLKR